MTTTQLEFVTCVIGALSLKTGQNCSTIYKKLKEANLINNYLIAAYDVLHTFSLEYVADDIMELLRQKGNELC